MNIEAVCKRVKDSQGALLPEYLVRVSHEEVMSLGAATFEPGELLCVSAAISQIDRAMTQLRWATRAMEAARG